MTCNGVRTIGRKRLTNNERTPNCSSRSRACCSLSSVISIRNGHTVNSFWPRRRVERNQAMSPSQIPARQAVAAGSGAIFPPATADETTRHVRSSWINAAPAISTRTHGEPKTIDGIENSGIALNGRSVNRSDLESIRSMPSRPSSNTRLVL